MEPNTILHPNYFIIYLFIYIVVLHEPQSLLIVLHASQCITFDHFP